MNFIKRMVRWFKVRADRGHRVDFWPDRVVLDINTGAWGRREFIETLPGPKAEMSAKEFDRLWREKFGN